ncbi:hypothetical protein GJ744_005377 [Endocarpon pusillum]|uniref:Uncharacterized protein n=1 Tax=Endocarpon pusillum TaxID=364733 RepID=A0A8H7AQE6_9EURO|nr:hypothetical protein GJ744_005377 [Endocarpon pusillum]
MHFSTTLLLSLSLALATSVVADDLDTESSPLGLRTKPVRTSKRAVSSLLDRRETCQGTCQACFGASYKDCPNSQILCYDPTAGSASEQCSSTPTTSASAGSTEIPETCYKKGASCVSCFGAGSKDCPAGSDYDCYDPAQYSQGEGCSAGGSTGSSAGASAPSPTASQSTDSCKATYGGGNIPCGPDHCYDPTAGESCCADGSNCKSGTTCVLRDNVYKCAQGGAGSSSPSLTSGSGSSRTASGILNTSTPAGVIGGPSSDATSSRATRTTSSRSSTITESAAAATTSKNSVFGAAPALMGRDTVAVAALAAGLLGLMGVL